MKEPWYASGLHFKCTGCGMCCTGGPGYVFLTEEDITTMACHLQLTKEAFMRRYTRQVGERISLLEDPENYDCVFLKEKRCSLYEARPKQCKSFPFWPQNIASERAWKHLHTECEGIDHPEGKLYTLDEIESI